MFCLFQPNNINPLCSGIRPETKTQPTNLRIFGLVPVISPNFFLRFLSCLVLSCPFTPVTSSLHSDMHDVFRGGGGIIFSLTPAAPKNPRPKIVSLGWDGCFLLGDETAIVSLGWDDSSLSWSWDSHSLPWMRWLVFFLVMRQPWPPLDEMVFSSWWRDSLDNVNRAHAHDSGPTNLCFYFIFNPSPLFFFVAIPNWRGCRLALFVLIFFLLCDESYFLLKVSSFCLIKTNFFIVLPCAANRDYLDKKIMFHPTPNKEYILDQDVKWSTRDSILSSTKSRVDHLVQKSARANLTQTAQHGLDSFFSDSNYHKSFWQKPSCYVVSEFHVPGFWMTARKLLK